MCNIVTLDTDENIRKIVYKKNEGKGNEKCAENPSNRIL